MACELDRYPKMCLPVRYRDAVTTQVSANSSTKSRSGCLSWMGPYCQSCLQTGWQRFIRIQVEQFPKAKTLEPSQMPSFTSQVCFIFHIWSFPITSVPSSPETYSVPAFTGATTLIVQVPIFWCKYI